MASTLLQEISQNEKEVAIFRSIRMAETDRVSDKRTMEIRVEQIEQKYKSVIANKDAELADKDAKLADKDAELADNQALIENLRLQIAQLQEK